MKKQVAELQNKLLEYGDNDLAKRAELLQQKNADYEEEIKKLNEQLLKSSATSNSVVNSFLSLPPPNGSFHQPQAIKDRRMTWCAPPPSKTKRRESIWFGFRLAKIDAENSKNETSETIPQDVVPSENEEIFTEDVPVEMPNFVCDRSKAPRKSRRVQFLPSFNEDEEKFEEPLPAFFDDSTAIEKETLEEMCGKLQKDLDAKTNECDGLSQKLAIAEEKQSHLIDVDAVDQNLAENQAEVASIKHKLRSLEAMLERDVVIKSDLEEKVLAYEKELREKSEKVAQLEK